MKRQAIFICSLTLSLVFAWLIVALISRFSPVQLTPDNFSYVLSPPTTDGASTPQRFHKTSIDYAGFISILLGFISALLAALGLGIAVLAVIGWKSISGKVEVTAADVINNSISEGQIKELIKTSLRDGGPLYLAVREETRAVMYSGIEPIVGFDSTNPTAKQ